MSGGERVYAARGDESINWKTGICSRGYVRFRNRQTVITFHPIRGDQFSSNRCPPPARLVKIRNPNSEIKLLTPMRFDVLTLFPDLFESYLEQSLLKKAIDRGLVEVHRWNFRDWASDKHQSVDDKPYGGGPGMLLCCQPVFDCVEAVQREGEA